MILLIREKDLVNKDFSWKENFSFFLSSKERKYAGTFHCIFFKDRKNWISSKKNYEV